MTTISALPVSFGLQWADVTPDARLAICIGYRRQRIQRAIYASLSTKSDNRRWLASCLSNACALGLGAQKTVSERV